MFENLIGNDNAKNLLKRDLNSGVFHAYLFLGEEGLGKFQFAKEFASNVIDVKLPHPDVKIIEGATILKSAIENLVEDAFLKPMYKDTKIYIIRDFHKVTTEGQNALLKTLEEPMAHVKLILTSSNEEGILPTILSRAKIVKFYHVPDEVLKDYFIKEGYEPSKVEEAVKFSVGSVGKAFEILNNENFFDLKNQVEGGLMRVFRDKGFEPYIMYKLIDEKQENMDLVLEITSYWLRDMVLQRELKGEDINISTDKLLKSYRMLIDVRSNLDRNVNLRTAVMPLLLYIGGEND